MAYQKSKMTYPMKKTTYYMVTGNVPTRGMALMHSSEMRETSNEIDVYSEVSNRTDTYKKSDVIKILACDYKRLVNAILDGDNMAMLRMMKTYKDTKAIYGNK